MNRTKRYYECHITMLGAPAYLKSITEALKWKFSCIDGDPVLGAGVKCYATMHYSSLKTRAHVIERVNAVAESLTRLGAAVIRRKVEYVLYDSKQGIIE